MNHYVFILGRFVTFSTLLLFQNHSQHSKTHFSEPSLRLFSCEVYVLDINLDKFIRIKIKYDLNK